MATTSHPEARTDLDITLVPLGTLWAQLAPPVILEEVKDGMWGVGGHGLSPDDVRGLIAA